MKIKKDKLKPGIFILSSMFFLITACTHEPQLIDELAEVCYTTDIEPLLQASCGTVECHAEPGHETRFATQSYAMVMSIVTPYDAQSSELYKVISTINSKEMMPPEQTLSKAQRNTILVWIEQGAKYKDCSIDTVPVVIAEPPIDTIPNDSVCFTQTIQPLLVSNCATTNCHSASAAEEGIQLTDYNAIMNSDEALVPYKPEESKIYKILLKNDEERMPPFPNKALTDDEKESLRKWIAQGAKNTKCSEVTCDTIGDISFANNIFPVINRNCVGCHNNITTNGGVNLSDFNNISVVASSTIDDVSKLIGVVNSEQGFPLMPPTGLLNDCDIRKIELWVKQGIQNN